MDAKTQLVEIAKKIDREVEDAIKVEFKSAKLVSPIIKDLWKNSTEIPVEGGKRIRGAFLYYSYLMCGGKNFKEIMKLTAAIELLHAFLLVHDDIMDQADLRRGFKTIHKIYEDHYKEKYKPIGGKHFGESMGINVGDIMSYLSSLIVSESKFPDSIKIKALNKLNRSIIDVGYGQVLDVYGEMTEVDQEYVLKVQRYKTGYYTYELPLHLGAIFAGVNGEYMHAISKYAVPGGIAFQIQDDILGVFGKEEKTGKSAASDIYEGKKTLLTIKAYEKATPAQKKILDETIGNRKATDEMIEEVRKIIRETGSLAYSKKMAKMYLTKSTKGLLENKKNKWVCEGIDFLVGINDYMYKREF